MREIGKPLEIIDAAHEERTGAPPEMLAAGRQPMPFVIRSLLKSLLIAALVVPFSFALPFCALRLCRTPGGAQFLFWVGPWSCCVLVLFYSQLSASKFWLGAEHVRQWRAAHGGLLHTSMRATAWMFGGLFFSYVAEFLMLFLVRPSPSGRALLPFFTYSPLAFCWLWRRRA